MASYRVVIKRSAEKELRKISRDLLARIAQRIGGHADDPRPHGCEKLSSRDEFRVRQGDHRIVYVIDDPSRLVTVVRIGHRREVYRQ
ncbi:MAG: type II toxin-antitoxin system RelE/ParE family toxin [Deltaproteobacteria bacterium]|nr:type II toxin-antitoxin system RelE/ParE family toxin [Deltaproteobacteria bacterium]